MTQIDDPILLKQSAAEFNRLEKQPPIKLVISRQGCLLLLCQLQIAFRHPGNNGQTRQLVEQFAKDIQAQLGIKGALQTLVERGWNPTDMKEGRNNDLD